MAFSHCCRSLQCNPVSQAPILTSSLCRGLCSSPITKFLHSRVTCLLYPMSVFGSVLGITDIQRAKQISQCPTGLLAHKEIKYCISNKHQMLQYTNSGESTGEETRQHELRSDCLGRLSRVRHVKFWSERKGLWMRSLTARDPSRAQGPCGQAEGEAVRMTCFRTSGAVETFLASVLNERDIVFNRENNTI